MNEKLTQSFFRIFKKPKQLSWVLIGIGIITPLIVGLIVKFYLASQGVNTIPISKAVYILPIVLYWVIPFVLLAGFAYIFLSWPQVHHGIPFWKRTTIISFGTMFGWITTIAVFWVGWQSHGDLVLVVAPFIVGGAILLGLAFGLVVATIATYFKPR